ncbi:MAG: GGDEF domain-containing protein [Planctomycetota bacterium]|jgi:diguanylate cyclase (GGDEF)-like protein|nr:GGDEF domain-containing protein [Planctomycetota bacterium]
MENVAEETAVAPETAPPAAEKRRSSLGAKLTAAVLATVLIGVALALTIAYFWLERALQERYWAIWRDVTQGIAGELSPDKIAAYRRAPPDAYYAQTAQQFAFVRKADAHIRRLGVRLPDAENRRDLSLFETANPAYENWAPAAARRQFYDDYARGLVEPLIDGDLFSINEPLFDAAGNFVGYVALTIEWGDTVRQWRRAFGILSLLVGAAMVPLCCLFIVVIRRLVVVPVQTMTAAAHNLVSSFSYKSAALPVDGSRDLSVQIADMKIMTNDELELLSNAMKTMEKKLNLTVTELKLDSFTKCYNRATFDAMLDQYYRHFLTTQAVFCLLVIDIDHFKNVNDSYGHAFGDAVILTLVKTLKGNIRASDYSFRYGGEEFAVILLTKMPYAAAIAEKIRGSFHEQILPEHPELRFSISIGVCEVAAEYESPGQIFKHADQALYQAKEGGRNRIVLYGAS